MFSATDDTLTTAASAEIPANEQAEGAEGSDSQQTPASTETPGEKLFAGKYKTAEELERGYQELLKMNSRKANPAETAKALGLTTDSPAQQTTPAPVQAQQATARQVVQQAAPDSPLGRWASARRSEGWSEMDINRAVAETQAEQTAKNAIAQALGPVYARQNQLALKTVVQDLTEEYDDFSAHLEDIGKYLAANPAIKAAIESGDSDEANKKYHLENAYLRVARTKAKNSTVAAKAAGAVDAKRQEGMKATTVTGGAGARGSSTDIANDRAKGFREAAERMNQGNDLF